MKLAEEIVTFAQSPEFQGIEGWIYDDCIWVSAAILSAMADNNISGPVFELGVYKGRYLSALHKCSRHYRQSQMTTVGLDTFAFSSPDDPTSAFASLFGSSDDLRLVTGDSIKTKPADILEACEAAPAFISVDGDHTVWSVLNDHVLCADALAVGGVIASDDFCNWGMIGLMDGIARFFLANNRHDIVPFAFSMNKLFSCHRAYHGIYTSAVVGFCEDNQDLPPASRFLDLRQRGEHWCKNELFGAECLIL